ncbi:hypothetical protein [Catenuloplanes japonicus]|uniref:hypothetical protein n=1 Tax=Catenuloplanes japonicus TaxID=33876 RepID=UPI0018DD94A3|nr:hypothetical protein [Catenuloplanes japonicus]
MSVDPVALTKIKISATNEPIRITFEPLGDAFELDPDEFLFLRMPTAELTSLEIYVWPNGISVWLPYPGKSDYVVLDAQDEEIGRI